MPMPIISGMTPVKSSNLVEVGYKNNNLFILFNTGVVYGYSNVPREIFDRLLVASSVGKFFHSHIKNNFEGIKLSEPGYLVETAL